jgi:hypothetical protein
VSAIKIVSTNTRANNTAKFETTTVVQIFFQCFGTTWCKVQMTEQAGHFPTSSTTFPVFWLLHFERRCWERMEWRWKHGNYCQLMTQVIGIQEHREVNNTMKLFWSRLHICTLQSQLPGLPPNNNVMKTRDTAADTPEDLQQSFQLLHVTRLHC